MRKNKAKATAKVDAFLAEPFANDEARMERIIEQAKAESFRRAAEQPENAKKKGLWRGAPALCALVIILIVAPIIAVIVNPVSFSKANQLVRKATVWVNDTFKLNIELPVEEEKEKVSQTETITVFDSAEEAAQSIGSNLLILDEQSGCKLKLIEITDYSRLKFINMKYVYAGKEIIIAMETVLDTNVEKPDEEVHVIECDAGTLWAWSTNGIQRATGYMEGWAVDVRTSLDLETAQTIFSRIEWLN